MAFTGFLAACFCWKIKRRRVPPSRSFTDQEKKLLDTSLAVSCDRTSAEMGSSYGFEMFDRSMSMESEDTQRCLEPVQITIEAPSGPFPPPPAEFAIPAPYGNIFISVQVTGHNKEYPDLLSGGSTLPRRSRTCFLKSPYDNMGPRVTATGSSTWSLPGAKGDKNLKESIATPMSKFSTEFTAL
ncbi:putative kek1 [Danaus plexippus plexippus]|uniref:Kek1 n=2 Tax=Danaus plexippus TaxID=13037 RepID=A0A212FEQ3_DANPL|nr:putative kek1 [Danaus plexippus plexippus]